MNAQRMMVAQAVLDGKLPADSLTWAEVYSLEMMVMDAIIEKRAEKSAMVFDSLASDLLQ